MTAIKGKVMVVDDQPSIRRLLKEILSDEGYEVITAANGLEALERAAEDPQLILMDMKMPGMGGIDALRELSEMGLSSRVIMMTAYGELDLVEQAAALGAYAHLAKPFDILKLCAMVNAFIAQCQMELQANKELASCIK